MPTGENIDRIPSLLIKHLQGKLQNEENVELIEWRNQSFNNSRLFSELTNANLLHEALSHLHHFEEEEENFNSINRSIKIARIIKRIYYTAAAASLLILLGLWYFYSPASKSTNSTTIVSNDVPAPKDNKVQLQLANGSIIMLDDTRNGVITQQGHTKIVMEKGQLSYPKTKHQETSQPLYNTLTTPRGAQLIVKLSDGSKVWLNAESSIRYPVQLSVNEREVEITGEAYFEIAPAFTPKATKTNFIVKVNNMKVEALGTHFNINSYNNEPEKKVTLIEGKVKVTGPPKAVFGSKVFDQDSKILIPGQQAQLHQNGEVQLTEDIHAESVVAWTNGEFNFTGDDDIEIVMRQIERWYNVQVVYEGKVTARLFGQISRDKRLSKLLELLQKTERVHFRIEGNKVFVKQ